MDKWIRHFFGDVFNDSTNNCLGTATNGWQLKDGTFARVQFCSFEKVIDRARGIRRSSNKCHPSWQLRDNPLTAIYLNLSVMLLGCEYFFAAEYRNSRFGQIYALLNVKFTCLPILGCKNYKYQVCFYCKSRSILFTFFILFTLFRICLYLYHICIWNGEDWNLGDLSRISFFLWQSENMHWSVK